jgi:hypothetical protein
MNYEQAVEIVEAILTERLTVEIDKWDRQSLIIGFASKLESVWYDGRSAGIDLGLKIAREAK